MIHFHFLMVCWMVFLSLMGIMSPIYLHWIFQILQFEMLSLMNLIFCSVWKINYYKIIFLEINFIGLGYVTSDARYFVAMGP